MENKDKQKEKENKEHWYKLSKLKNFQLLALGMMYLSIQLLLYIVTLYLARGVGIGSIFYEGRDLLLVFCTVGYVFLFLYTIAIVAYLFNRILDYHDTVIQLEKELDILKRKP